MKWLVANTVHYTCPFCGSDSVAVTENKRTIVARVEFYVHCCECGAVGPTATLYARALELWDARSTITVRSAVVTHEVIE